MRFESGEPTHAKMNLENDGSKVARIGIAATSKVEPREMGEWKNG